MGNEIIGNVATRLANSGNNELANKWMKLAQEFEPQLNPYEPQLNPNVENFARNLVGNEEKKMKEHTCSVTFTAPENVGEDEMMRYITGIKNELPGVQVGGFKWSVKD